MTRVFLGIGTNIGRRQANIKKALTLLRQEGIGIEKVSKIIETDPIGGPPQPKYLNAVVSVNTCLSPRQLLKKIKKIENDMGRIKTARLGPRIIDLDILLYSNLVLESKDLTIPHPRMWERDFVLGPLSSLISLSSLKDLKVKVTKR